MHPGLPIAGADPDEPSRSLPLAHFAAAAVSLAAGAAALLVVAGDLAAGNLFDPRVLATTHLFTLGVIATAIFGAMYQFVPAVLGVPLRSRPVAWTGWVLLETGLLALVGGLWFWIPALQGAGWLLLFGAVGCSGWNILPARRRASRNRAVGTYISLAHSWLGLNMVLAAARIGDGLGWWHTERSALLAAHFHLGVFGFATLTIVGFGNRMVPAFLQSSGYPAWPFRYVGWTGSAGLAAFTAAMLGGPSPLRAAGAILMLAGISLYLREVWGYYRTRRAADFDPGLGFITAAHLGLGAAALAGAVLAWTAPPPGRPWVGYGVIAILGWPVMMVLGVMHRVVQRIVTQQLRILEGARAARLGRGDLIDRRIGWLTLAAFAAGTLLLAAGAQGGAPMAAKAGAGAVATAAVLVLWQGVRLLRARFS